MPELVFLGTGGADNTPQLGCSCHICSEARQKNGRFRRNGPSVYLAGPNLLFDTPEDIGHSLEREDIHEIRHLTWSHWHPDHTMGRRVLEESNNFIFHPELKKSTDVWLAKWVADDFRKYMAIWDHLQFFVRNEIVKIHEIGEAEPAQIGPDTTLHAYRIPEPDIQPACFLVNTGGKRIVLVLDESKFWKPSQAELSKPDLLILQAGWFEKTVDGKQIVPMKHWVRDSEASFEDTLRIIDRVNPGKTILNHIEHINTRSYTDYLALEKEYSKYNLQFAYDGLRIKL